MGCGEGKDSTAPEKVQITGGVTAEEAVTGWRTLQASAEDDSGKVSKVEFYVSDTLACVDGVAKSSGATFSCAWDSSSVAQGGHQLTARAYDAAGNVTRSQPLSFTVAPPNRLPTISGVTVTTSSLDEGSSTTFTVTASDSDGDALTYSWTQTPFAPAGTFGDETGATRTWTAPLVSTNTTFTLKVTVSDGKGGTTQSSLDVTVANVPSRNRAPTVDETITVPTARVVAGDTVILSIGANDQDGDTLTYTWTTTNTAGEGIFTNRNAPVAEWRSPDLRTATTYSFQVTVSDGADSVTRSGEVQLQIPSYSRDIQPLWGPTCTDCHNANSTTPQGLNLEASSSYASLVNVGGTEACSALNRVQPGSPDDSLLVQRLSSDSCGRRMPPLDADYFDRNAGELTRIRSWILAGAAND
ncbi:PKD domain-containing protein [Archangium violaceum]|uniref:PKD domain-containing protein n=1 Tax=Archangium violaceum TaxID=83451 RepID=UPI001EF72B6C|nr:Ig-like domain-containing protein [Archangium violaceum]